MNFIKKYNGHDANLEKLIRRLTVICEYYNKQDYGVDKFLYGEDYRPDMPADESNIINEKHIFGIMLKRKTAEEYSDPTLDI